jgi:hypothetical protein
MLLASALLLGLGSLQQSAGNQAAPVELFRKFTVGEKLTYVTKAVFTDEQRVGSLQTFLPSDEEITYRHSLEVKKLKADGIAEVLYLRPTMTITEGDTGDSEAKSTVNKTDERILLDITPINEVIQMKDLNPKKEKKGGENKSDGLRLRTQGQQADAATQILLQEYVGDFQRLAFFVGSLDTGLDISPRTPFEEVKVGDTWKKTATYQPQKLKGQGDKQAVQRLDYTYTYLGLMKNKEGKEVQRIQAKVIFENDISEYARQLVGASKGAMYIKSAPIKFTGQIDFDCDPATMHLLKATAESNGSFSLNLKGVDMPYVEDRFKGRTTVKLESWIKGGIAKPEPAKSVPPPTKTNTNSKGKKSGGGL